jgi:hypothetical protein
LHETNATTTSFVQKNDEKSAYKWFITLSSTYDVPVKNPQKANTSSQHPVNKVKFWFLKRGDEKILSVSEL